MVDNTMLEDISPEEFKEAMAFVMECRQAQEEEIPEYLSIPEEEMWNDIIHKFGFESAQTLTFARAVETENPIKIYNAYIDAMSETVFEGEEEETIMNKQKYFVTIREELITRDYAKVETLEEAFDRYHAAKDFNKAMGLNATVDLVDGITGEVLASTYKGFC